MKSIRERQEAISNPLPTDPLAGKTLPDHLAEWLGGLPAGLDMNAVDVHVSALKAYLRHGATYMHLLRYCLGWLALKVKDTLPYGSDAIGRCADKWGIHHTTLRMYTSAARRTNGNINLFYRFLTHGPGQKTQSDIARFASAMLDRDVTPEDVATEIRAERVDTGLAMVENNIGHIREDERQSITVALAHTIGVDVVHVSKDDMLLWLDEALVYWLEGNALDEPPTEYIALKGILER